MPKYSVTMLGRAIIALLVLLIILIVILIISLMNNTNAANLGANSNSDNLFEPAPPPPKKEDELRYYIYFDPDSSYVLKDQYEALDRVVEMAKKNATKLLYIEGYAVKSSPGSVGDSEAMKLSEARAWAATEYIMYRGVPGYQIVVLGKGDAGSSVDGMSRRVEMYLKDME